jgi:3-deoxy-D-manno-octulosonate 8-phosphate phosphatase (KDO 8-P phosphatase)
MDAPHSPFIAFVLDVDGVLTDGGFWYDASGKVLKRFGPDDSDALAMLRDRVEVRFVSADHRGFPVTRQRIEDMGYPLDLVPSSERLDWIAERWPVEQTVYMGDGILDPPILAAVGYSIVPANGDAAARAVADLVTERGGGDRAVAEACLHLIERVL